MDSNKLQQLENKLESLQQRLDVVEEENANLKKENTYLGLLIATTVSDQTLLSTKRMWGDSFNDIESDRVDGSYIQVLEEILLHSTNDAIDMFVISQLAHALPLTRLDTTLSLQTVELIIKVMDSLDCDDEDFAITLKCVRWIVTSTPTLIGFCVDMIIKGYETSSEINKSTAIEAFYSIILNNDTHVIYTKIINALLKQIDYVIHSKSEQNHHLLFVVINTIVMKYEDLAVIIANNFMQFCTQNCLGLSVAKVLSNTMKWEQVRTLFTDENIKYIEEYCKDE
ncbi:Uncharacterized protein QTN25_009593 [Entamoeba marina]